MQSINQLTFSLFRSAKCAAFDDPPRVDLGVAVEKAVVAARVASDKFACASAGNQRSDLKWK
jgi:hypothetical protein